MPMPSWWKGKSSKSSNPSSPASTKASPRANRSSDKKARSFDEAVATRAAALVDAHHGSSPRCSSLAAPGVGAPGGFFSPSSSPSPPLLLSPTEPHHQPHPLPRPLNASLSMPHDAASTTPPAAATPSGSVSSTSSSGSYDDGAPDLAAYRYVDPSNTPRGRALAPEFRRKQFPTEPTSPVPEQERLSYFPVSPKRGAANQTTYFTPAVANDGAAAYSHRVVASIDTRSRTGSLSPGPRPRGYALQGSPITTAKMFGLAPESPLGGKQQDDQRSPHPLPLPPGSPTSPASSHSLQSKWKKGKLLGRGTFGHVYAGFNSESGQMCAIKEVEIISGDNNSKECLKQLNQEINMLSQLSHPNIVRYYGSELIDGTLSVYLEYVSGGSIHKLLQEYGPFSEPVIRSYAGQILSGLAYLHARNTIHRDIKGANILVGSNGEVKLADFGMAKHISSYTSIHSFKGSPYWMAPEVIMNSNGYGYSLPVDIWSLGCTIIEMASSKPPWNSFTGVQAIFKIGNSKDIPEIPDHLSNEAKSFVKLCLQRDPSARPTAAKLLEHPFVRDQAKTNFSMASTRDAYHMADGTRSPTMAPVDLAYNRSRSPMRDGNFSMRHTIAHSPALKNPSEILGSLRPNMSLPVSPCSSPLRQFKQSNWSCLPSPPHPIQTLVAATSAYSTCSPYQNGVSSRYTDRWPDLSAAVSRSPYGSSRT